jgi:hypothetical protein
VELLKEIAPGVPRLRDASRNGTQFNPSLESQKSAC